MPFPRQSPIANRQSEITVRAMLILLAGEV